MSNRSSTVWRCVRAVTKCKSFRIVSQTILITLTQRMIPLQQGLYLSVERHCTFDLVCLQDPFRWQPGVEHHGWGDAKDLWAIRRAGGHRYQTPPSRHRQCFRLREVQEPRHGCGRQERAEWAVHWKVPVQDWLRQGKCYNQDLDRGSRILVQSPDDRERVWSIWGILRDQLQGGGWVGDNPVREHRRCYNCCERDERVPSGRRCK